MIINNVGSYITTTGSAIGGFGGIIDSPSTSFVGPLDALVAEGAEILCAFSVRRLLSIYTGSGLRLRGNGTGSPEADIGFTSSGDCDLAAAAAIAAQDGGTAAFGKIFYTQAGSVSNANQGSAASQMQFSTALQAKGAFGHGTAAPNVFFLLNLLSLTFPVFISTAVNYSANAGTQVLLGTFSSSTNRFARITNGAMTQNWGTTLAGSATEITSGKHVLGFLANGASSEHYDNGSLLLTGDANQTQINMSAGRLGASNSSTTNWLNQAGNSLSEFIVFQGNPTGLAGWSNFVNNQIAYFN